MRSRKARRPQAKIGAPPGTLIHVGERKAEQPRIRLIEYNESKLEDRGVETAAHASGFREPSTVTWLNIDGLHDIRIIEEVGRHFDIHPLVQEDILNTYHRPKLEPHDNGLFLVLKMLQLDPSGEIQTEQVSLILGENYVVSLQEKEGDVFDRVRERLRSSKGRIRKMGADYLAYSLIDSIVDGYYAILEELGDRIEGLEDELVSRPGSETLRKIHALRRQMINLRRSVWPLREVIGSLQRQEEPFVREGTRIYLRDVYDHTIQVVDTVETYRDMITGMLDLYLSSISNRMNEVMKVLTVIATIFIPLTFLAGVYGMNFEHMPELHWKWAYPAIWAIMIGLGVGMLVFFRRKGWF